MRRRAEQWAGSSGRPLPTPARDRAGGSVFLEQLGAELHPSAPGVGTGKEVPLGGDWAGGAPLFKHTVPGRRGCREVKGGLCSQAELRVGRGYFSGLFK